MEGKKGYFKLKITIYATLIYTAPCIMFWMRAYPLLGQAGGRWALEFESFLGPVKWHRADRRCHLGPKKLEKILCTEKKNST
jgi:hypothetical protein